VIIVVDRPVGITGCIQREKTRGDKVYKTGRKECNAESRKSIGIKIKYNHGVKNETRKTGCRQQ
jgi:hypothetical protein